MCSENYFGNVKRKHMEKMIRNSQPVRLAGSVVMLLALALSLTLSSFSNNIGGDTYEVRLNGKLLLRQLVWNQTSVPDLSLDPKTSEDNLAVYYSHCGQPGKGRSLSIQDEKHSILKEWRFDDISTGEHTPMNCSVKDIAALYRKHGKLNLYYTSKELPDAKQLVSLTIADDVTSRR
jgi:hypothetical protein